MASGMAMVAGLAELLCRLGLASTRSRLVVASATAPADSGLLPHLAKAFEASGGDRIRLLPLGTGEALARARSGGADLVIGHDFASEQEFVADGDGLRRWPLMWNDYLLGGPSGDPAGIARASDAGEAFRRIAGASAPFVSRGDDGASHRREREIWRHVGIAPEAAAGGWYRETAAGARATLATAAATGAYTLVDRGMWLAFATRRDLRPLFEGDPALRNEFAVIPLDPVRHLHVDGARTRAFVDWLTSPAGRREITEFTIDGECLYHVTRTGADEEEQDP